MRFSCFAGLVVSFLAFASAHAANIGTCQLSGPIGGDPVAGLAMTNGKVTQHADLSMSCTIASGTAATQGNIEVDLGANVTSSPSEMVVVIDDPAPAKQVVCTTTTNCPANTNIFTATRLNNTSFHFPSVPFTAGTHEYRVLNIRLDDSPFSTGAAITATVNVTLTGSSSLTLAQPTVTLGTVAPPPVFSAVPTIVPASAPSASATGGAASSPQPRGTGAPTCQAQNTLRLSWYPTTVASKTAYNGPQNIPSAYYPSNTLFVFLPTLAPAASSDRIRLIFNSPDAAAGMPLTLTLPGTYTQDGTSVTAESPTDPSVPAPTDSNGNVPLTPDSNGNATITYGFTSVNSSAGSNIELTACLSGAIGLTQPVSVSANFYPQFLKDTVSIAYPTFNSQTSSFTIFTPAALGNLNIVSAAVEGGPPAIVTPGAVAIDTNYSTATEIVSQDPTGDPNLGGWTASVTDNSGQNYLLPMYKISCNKILAGLPAGLAFGAATLNLTSPEGLTSNQYQLNIVPWALTPSRVFDPSTGNTLTGLNPIQPGGMVSVDVSGFGDPANLANTDFWFGDQPLLTPQVTNIRAGKATITGQVSPSVSAACNAPFYAIFGTLRSMSKRVTIGSCDGAGGLTDSQLAAAQNAPDGFIVGHEQINFSNSMDAQTGALSTKNYLRADWRLFSNFEKFRSSLALSYGCEIPRKRYYGFGVTFGGYLDHIGGWGRGTARYHALWGYYGDTISSTFKASSTLPGSSGLDNGLGTPDSAPWDIGAVLQPFDDPLAPLLPDFANSVPYVQSDQDVIFTIPPFNGEVVITITSNDGTSESSASCTVSNTQATPTPTGNAVSPRDESPMTVTVPGSLIAMLPVSAQDPNTGVYSGQVELSYLPAQPSTPTIPNVLAMFVSYTSTVTITDVQIGANRAAAQANVRAPRTR